MTKAPRPKSAQPSGETKLYSDFRAEPLGLDRLVRIWKSLPECDRLPFLLSLDERIGDKLMEATMPGVKDRPL
jgi:hypothetical protein